MVEQNDTMEESNDSEKSSTESTDKNEDDTTSDNNPNNNMNVTSYTHFSIGHGDGDEKGKENIQPADLCMMAVESVLIELGDETNLPHTSATDISKNTSSIMENNNEEWLIDSGATNHFTYSKDSMINIIPSYKRITVAGGQTAMTECSGTLILTTKNGTQILLSDVHYIPKFAKNIISISKLVDKGCVVSGITRDFFTIRSANGTMIRAARDITDQLYYIQGARQVQRGANGQVHASIVNVEKTPLKNMDPNVAHRIMGHISLALIKRTAETAGWKLLNVPMLQCGACALAKARAKAVPRSTTTKATTPGMRLFVDISGPFTKSLIGSTYWLMIVDDYSGKKWSRFLKTKAEIHGALRAVLLSLKNVYKMDIQYIRCDNAGENLKHINTLGLEFGFQLECTAPHTPKHNGKVERGFAVIRERAVAMMIDAKLAMEFQKHLWAEAVSTATNLSNDTMTMKGTQTANQLFYANTNFKQRNDYKHLYEWGRVAYVAKRDAHPKKFAEKGKKCVFLGYADDHATDTFKFYNAQTQKIILSRDVTWGEWHGRITETEQLPLFQQAREIPIQLEKEDILNDYENNVSDQTFRIVLWDVDADLSKYATRKATQGPQAEANNPEDNPTANEPHEPFTPPDDVNENIFDEDVPVEEAAPEAPTYVTPVRIPINETPPLLDTDPTETGGLRPRQLNAPTGTGTRQTSTTTTQPDSTTGRQRIAREVRALRSTFNHPYSYNVQVSQEEPNDFNIYYMGAASLNSSPGIPRNFQAVLKHPDRDKWIACAQKEYNSFMDRYVWVAVSKSQIPVGQRAMSTRWIFVKKIDPTNPLRQYEKGRLCVRGYEQIPGVDFTESFSPVATDSAVMTFWAMSLYYRKHHDDWANEMVDIETAFLNADLEEEVYIQIPEGLEYMTNLHGETYDPETQVLKLRKAMYGLVQAPRAWMKTFVKILKHMGLKQCRTDPCVFYLRKDEEVKLILNVYCDDVLLSGLQTEIDNFKSNIKRYLKIKEIGKVKRHLGVDYNIEPDERSLEIHMTEFVQEIISDYEQETKKVLKIYDTPGTTSEPLLENAGNKERQEQYRSYVGRLLFAIKKCIPDCSNAIRELSQHLENPGVEQWKSVERLLGYLKGHYRPLKMEAPKELRINGAVDSNWAMDRKDRKSITGYIITVGGCIVSWMSKKQQGVTLSSTEAEYVALSTAATEVKFLRAYTGDNRTKTINEFVERRQHRSDIFVKEPTDWTKDKAH